MGLFFPTFRYFSVAIFQKQQLENGQSLQRLMLLFFKIIQVKKWKSILNIIIRQSCRMTCIFVSSLKLLSYLQ